MDIILGASIIAAFLAGMVALFAPCCVTVLLPAYLASVFRKKTRMVAMTLVFFAGITAILVPIALGVAWLAELFQDFHKELYIIGGLLMFGLSVLAVSGRGFALIPMPKKRPLSARGSGVGSIFLLGLFSGAATSCCAPVLAGAITLAVISGAFWKALIVAFAYVFGMTLPLFLAAYAYDRFHLEELRFIRGKLLHIHFGTKTLTVHSTNIFAAGIFFVMGIVLLSLASTGNAFWAPAVQSEVGKTLNAWSLRAFAGLERAPDALWGMLIIGLFFFFLLKARRLNNRKKYDSNTDQREQ